MCSSELGGKNMVLAVIFSTIVFLVLHSTELPGQEYGNKTLLNLYRVLIFAPFLTFLYMGMNWARITYAIICTMIVLAGVVGFLVIGAPWATLMNVIFLSVMMACMIFNASVLFFSSSLKAYMRNKKELRHSAAIQ